MSEPTRAPSDPAPAPEALTIPRADLKKLLDAARLEGIEEGRAEALPAASPPELVAAGATAPSGAPPRIAGASNGGDSVTLTRAQLRQMMRDILAEARALPTQAPAGVGRAFHYDPAQHAQVHLPNADLYGHRVVETDVPGEFVHTTNGELYNEDGRRLGRVITVHHPAPEAEAAA